MNYLLKANKNLLIYFLVIVLVIPILGIKFILSFLGNILILFFLIPALIFLLMLIGFNYYKSKINVCDNCGAISLGLSENCNNCGANLVKINNKDPVDKKPSESIIEIKAEEIK